MMEKHEVVWSTRAIGQRFIISEWYKDNIGEIASTHFNNDLNNTIDAISAMPTIGMYSAKFSSSVKPYTYQELNSRIDESERQMESGETISGEQVHEEMRNYLKSLTA